jgi:hypothetical protein
MKAVEFRGYGMNDLLFLTLILVFFLATLGLAWIAEHLMR